MRMLVLASRHFDWTFIKERVATFSVLSTLSELRERCLPSIRYEAVTRRAKNQSFKY